MHLPHTHPSYCTQCTVHTLKNNIYLAYPPKLLKMQQPTCPCDWLIRPTYPFDCLNKHTCLCDWLMWPTWPWNWLIWTTCPLITVMVDVYMPCDWLIWSRWSCDDWFGPRAHVIDWFGPRARVIDWLGPTCPCDWLIWLGLVASPLFPYSRGCRGRRAACCRRWACWSRRWSSPRTAWRTCCSHLEYV